LPAKPTVSRLYKESITIKGYRTKNFTRELAEQFQEQYKDTTDKFALFNCTVCCDKLLGTTKEEVSENFDEMKVAFERAVKYLTKLNMTVDLDIVEDWLLEVAILEGQTFTAKDKTKVANIIAANVGHKSASKDPTEMVHGAIDHIKKNRYTPDAWKLMGNMFNMASKSGIKWDRDKFARHTQRYMGLK
jgi:transcriptional antiterminator